MNKNMGQRLVITLHEHGELGNAFAALYYHWSGFSTYSFCEATPIAKIVSSYDGSKKKLVNKILDYIESKGGGLDGGQEKYLSKHRWFNPGRYLMAIQTGMRACLVYPQKALRICLIGQKH